MTTAEIKALLSELKTNRSASARDCIDSIETLLARQSEVLELSRHYSLNYTDIRALLKPENESTHTMTASEVRHYQNNLRDRAEIEGRD